MAIHIDFETRSAIDLKEVGTYEYAADKSTDVLCFAWAIGDSEVRVWTPGKPFPAELAKAIAAGEEMFGWNVAFERCIWSEVCVAKYGFPPVPFAQWACTMAMAAAMGLPQSLEMCAKTLGCEHQKDTRGKRVMLKCARPRKVIPGGDLLGQTIVWWEDPSELNTVYSYCAVDVQVERDLHGKLKPLSAREHKVWQLDQMINDRGLAIDRKLCQNAIVMVRLVQDELVGELKEITGCQVTSVNEIENLKTWLANRDVPVTTLGATDVAQLLKTELPDDVHRVLTIRQQAGKNSTAKFESMLARSKSGRMRGNLRYYGAATGRWSGSGAQIQNFPRGSYGDMDHLAELILSGERGLVELYGDTIEMAKSALRGAIVADEGKMLNVWDFAQIEARVLAWLAGETALVQQFAEGKDVYKAFASKVFAKPEANVTKGERFIAKTMVLGLGYGMGAAKFKATLANYGTDISDEFAQKAVQTYRSTFPAIADLWSKTEVNAITKQKGWRGEENFLVCKLPSGRDLYYFNPLLKDENGRLRLRYSVVIGTTTGFEETYGGKLVENLVQATARDVLVDGMFALEQAGIPIVATVHDEIIAECDGDRMDEGIELLTKTQPWSSGLPLAVEGFVCRRYRK